MRLIIDAKSDGWWKKLFKKIFRRNQIEINLYDNSYFVNQKDGKIDTEWCEGEEVKDENNRIYIK